jgi:hypothetical protein
MRQTIERESKQEGGIIKKTNRRERGKGKRNIEGEKRRFLNNWCNLH